MRGAVKGCVGAIVGALALVLTVLLLGGVWFGYQGYGMYRQALAETSISEKVEEIENREGFTPYENLPEIYVQAVVSAEDRRFFQHNGVDFLSICRAVWNDLRSFSLAEGGSTITQQLMKNEYFTQERKLERKFAEIFAAWDLEKECSKEEIFALYANTIYFGSGYYGIYEAAQGYYGKEPWELTAYEAVMLAGLPNAPSVYSLDENPELAKQRMSQVLGCMVENQAISLEQAEQILGEG